MPPYSVHKLHITFAFNSNLLKCYHKVCLTRIPLIMHRDLEWKTLLVHFAHDFLIQKVKFCSKPSYRYYGTKYEYDVELGNWEPPCKSRREGQELLNKYMKGELEMGGCARCAHRENQSAEAAAINNVCKPRRPAGGFFVSEFVPISLTKPFRKERCRLDSSILFGKVL